ncbi:MAG: adenylate/guanylate cyclase domain-containing protein [Hyphomicrobiales bacterium]|nr:adenylate/guanylate cyclase domain-containing protein [Hyphomicrobiales bacterium]MCP4997728.1 adenylate/guanylate cyclase domain-containing protein [Hyphomicrobiales bacterium]
MGADEAGTLAAMRGHRKELWKPIIKRFGGRIVGTAGDSILVEFASAVAAVESSIAVQQGMIERNADVPDYRRMLLRIGINIGEVIVAGDDIYGDGVNVAARLQELSEPGGIAVSAHVHEQIEGKLDAQFADDGLHEVKNIARPVPVWRWAPDGTQSGIATKVPLAPPDKPSIAVLPFDNMSGDSEQDYFADGMAEDITTALSHMYWFTVIGRNSSFRYKGKAVDLNAVGRDLGVRYLLEGSVRKAGNRVRINVQLIESASGNHIWAKRYDGQLEDVFDFQDQISEQIVGAIEPEIRQAEIQRTRRKRPENLSAYDLVLRAYPLVWRMDPKASNEARALLEQATALDPDYAEAWALMALSYFTDAGRAGALADIMAFREKLVPLCEKLAQFGQSCPLTLITLGVWRVLVLRDQHEAALVQLRSGLERNPNMAIGWGALGLGLCYVEQTREGFEALEKACRLSPFDPAFFLFKFAQALGHFVDGNYLDSIECARESVNLNPNWVVAHRYLAAALALSDQIEEAQHVGQLSLDYDPNFTLAIARMIAPLPPEPLERYIDGLRKAGLPE